MGLFRRRRPLPADRRPPLEREERVLAWARVAETETVVVVTNRGLWLPDRAVRLGWHEINKVVWSGRELTFTPAGRIAERDGYDVVVDLPSETFLLLDPDDVPRQVRQRVTGSVGHTSHHELPGGGVRVVGRRVSGVDGLSWTVRYDPGTSGADEAVVAQTDEIVAAARRATRVNL